MTTDVLETSAGIFKKVASTIRTATADRTPKNIVLEEDLTVYLGGAGMTGGAPLLVSQVTESSERKDGAGHFYYGLDGPSGEQRCLVSCLRNTFSFWRVAVVARQGAATSHSRAMARSGNAVWRQQTPSKVNSLFLRQDTRAGKVSLCTGLALMSSAKAVRAMIIVAIVLISPFALFEIYAVIRFGFAEPYSYLLSVPQGIISFLLLQFAIGLGVVKGWANCRVPDNYYLIALWIVSLLVLFLLPVFF